MYNATLRCKSLKVYDFPVNDWENVKVGHKSNLPIGNDEKASYNNAFGLVYETIIANCISILNLYPIW